MKIKMFTLSMLLVLSISVFADDGTTHSGGKTCQQEQTSCLTSEMPGVEDTTKDSDFFKDVLTYLKTILFENS